MADWISVKDRLPEPWVTVLLWDGDQMVSGYMDYNGDLIDHRWGQVFRATHWMLPEPPGEGDADWFAGVLIRVYTLRDINKELRKRRACKNGMEHGHGAKRRRGMTLDEIGGRRNDRVR